MLKKVIGIACTVIFTMVSLNAVFGEDKISLRVNHQDVSFSEQSPIIENGKVMAPLRDVAEAMGISIDMCDRDGEIVLVCMDNKKAVDIIDGKDEITIWDINSDKSDDDTLVLIGDSERRIPFEEPIKIINGETLVPVRIFAESFGAEVLWDEDSKTVGIFMSVDMEELEKVFGLIGGMWKNIDLKISESDNLTKEMFKEISDELLIYVEEVENSYYINQKTVDSVADELEKYLQAFEDFAKENSLDVTAGEEDEEYALKKFNGGKVYNGEVIDISKNLEAYNRLLDIIERICEKICDIDEKVRTEIVSIIREIGEDLINLSNSGSPVNQKEADEITEKCEEYIRKLTDLADRNNISINLD